MLVLWLSRNYIFFYKTSSKSSMQILFDATYYLRFRPIYTGVMRKRNPFILHTKTWRQRLCRFLSTLIWIEI